MDDFLKKSNKNLKYRILNTLEIVEERGYNLTLEKLSKNLIGGKIDKNILKKEIENSSDFDFDGKLVSTFGNLNPIKCNNRLKYNSNLYDEYLKIANEFKDNYLSLGPWIKCIMFTGSIATDGLIEGDDIDLNIIVKNDSKYISWLIGILLCIKFSIKYRKKFDVKWFNLIKGVVCICVIWEEKEVLPFIRNDKQIAYELLLNLRILHNDSYYDFMISKNPWFKNWFPQIFENIKIKKIDINKKNSRLLIKWIFNPLSKFIVIISYWIYRGLIFWNNNLNDRIDKVLKVQYPYSIIDNPKK